MRKLIIFTLTLALAALIGSGSAIAKPDKEKRHHHSMGATVHQAKYMQLLAERYTPESSAEWKKVFEERERLLEQVKNQEEANRDSFRSEMRRLFQEGEGKMKGHMETMQQFTRAVESGDDKLIKEALPKVLAAEQQFNSVLSEALKSSAKAKKK